MRYNLTKTEQRFEKALIILGVLSFIFLLAYNIGIKVGKDAYISSCEPVGIHSTAPEWLECPLSK